MKARITASATAIAVARFNDFITSRLLAGAQDGLVRHGVDEGSITVAWTAGAFELPLQRMQADNPVGYLLKCANHCLVIRLHGDVVAGSLDAQVAAQNAAVEDHIPKFS